MFNLKGSDKSDIIHPRFYNFGEGRIIFDEPEVASELDSLPVKSQDPYIARFQYYLKDHLGNTMVIYEDRDKDLLIKPEDQEHAYDVVERFMYYPFGMKWEDVWPLDFNPEVDEENRYLYNGKELHRGSGLYDYGFRYYMAEIGRFTGVDPLADQMPSWSSYNYTFNNPILLIDPDGRAPYNPGDPGNPLFNTTLKIELKFTQGVYGAEFRALGSKFGGTAKINAQNRASVVGGISTNEGFILNGSLNEKSSTLGFSYGNTLGLGFDHAFNSESNETSNVLQYDLGLFYNIEEFTYSGSNENTEHKSTTGVSLGATVGSGLFGIEASISLENTANYSSMSKEDRLFSSTFAKQQDNQMQRDNTRIDQPLH